MADCDPNQVADGPNDLSLFQLQGQQPFATGTITKDNFFQLKCFGCLEYLSGPPVYSAKDGSSNKCHKCYGTNPNDYTHYYRNVLYETLAEKLVFPCHRSSECPGAIRWNQQAFHDETCEYKAITCPYPGCGVSIEMFQIYPHFHMVHTASAVHPATVRLFNNHWDLIALRHDDHDYLIHYRTRNGMLWLEVLTMSKHVFPYMFTVVVTDGTLQYVATEPCSQYFSRNLFDVAAMNVQLHLYSLFPYRDSSNSFDITVQVHSPATQRHVQTCGLCGVASEWDFRFCGVDLICFSCHQNQVLCPHCGIEFEDKTNYPSTVLPFLTMANSVRIASHRKTNGLTAPPPVRYLYNRVKKDT